MDVAPASSVLHYLRFAQIHVQAFFAHAYDIWGCDIPIYVADSLKKNNPKEAEHKVEAISFMT